VILIASAVRILEIGGNTSDMMLFNDLINHLDLAEVPLKNRAFTWSNMQQNALLVKLD
jgi:hypothetical protein